MYVSGFSKTYSRLEGAEICKSKYLKDVGCVFGREIPRDSYSLSVYNQTEPPTSEQLSPG